MDVIILSVTIVFLPEITKQVTVRKKVPWFTQEIREKKRVVHRRETIWKKYRRDDQWQALKIERSSYRRMLKKAKAESITMMVQDCKRDSKKLYNLAALLMGMVKENPLPDHTDKEELANQFACFFINKIQKIRDQLDNLPTYCHRSTDPPEFLEFELMIEEEVGNVIKGMPAKMCDMDIIPTTLLKDALPGLLPTITKIANASMTQGVFLSSWKIALVKPLLKKLSLKLIESNYRPVHNLPFLSKVVEKCLLRRFNKHCEKYDLMPDYQAAYQANYSCETVLVKIMDNILWSMEKQEVVPLIAIDLSAAFETVDHDLLLAVLRKKFGIDQVTLKWFRSYLRQQQFRVQVGDKRSAPIDLLFSVLHGSCAGPILYSVYASTLREVIQDPLSQSKGTTNETPAPESDSSWQLSPRRSIDLHGFADEHAYKKGLPGNSRESEVKTIKDLEQCATRIKSWMDGNRLKMNDGKTEFIMLGSKYQLNKCITHQININ